MKMRKIIAASAALLAVGSLSLGLTNLSAFAQTTDLEGFAIAGASVRTENPMGIRFLTEVPEEIKESYTFGTLIIPKAELAGDTLDINTAKALNIETSKWQTKEDGKPYSYTSVLGGLENGGSITDFPKSQYNASIVARSYAKDGEGNVVDYTETVERSVAGVASMALADTTEDEITDETKRVFLQGICDYVLGEDGFAFAQNELKVTNKNNIDLSTLFAETNGSEGLSAIWKVTGDCLTLQYDANGIATSATVNKTGTATLSATIGSTTQELTVSVDLTEFYQTALQFNDENALAIVENSYVKDDFAAASIITDGDRTVLAASFGAKAKGGYKSTLTIGIGGMYKASEINKIVITLRVPELAGSAGSTFYKAGANVSSSGSSSEISISSASVSNGTAKPTVTSDYITIPVTGEQLATALGSGDVIVNNIALWNNTSGGAQHPVTVYIDSISVQKKEVVETEKDLLLFNDEDSLAIVENSYVKDGFPTASIITDGDRKVLSGVFTAKSTAGYKGALTIGVGGKYKASEIASVVITFRVPELVGNAGKTWFKAGANVSSSGSSSEISVPSASVSNGKGQPTVTADYLTMTITGAQLVTALGSGDTIVNNIALWNSTSSGAQPVNVYIDSIVINLA